MMEEILEKKVNPVSTKSLEVKQKPLTRTVNPQLEAIEVLTKLSGSLVEQVRDLSLEIDSLKDRIAQVASRLGL
jgi:regulator of replication initiation timing